MGLSLIFLVDDETVVVRTAVSEKVRIYVSEGRLRGADTYGK